jgi:hypothetical protein
MIDWSFIYIVLLLLCTLSLLALGQVAVFMRFVSGFMIVFVYSVFLYGTRSF